MLRPRLHIIDVYIACILAVMLVGCVPQAAAPVATVAGVAMVVSPGIPAMTATVMPATPTVTQVEATSATTPAIAVNPTASPTGISDTPTSAASVLQPCRIVEMQVSSGFQGATGSLAGGIDFTNRSAQACTLSGRPTVEVLDAQGQVLPITYHAANDTGLTIILQPGQHAGSFMTWSNWCGQVPAFPLSLRIRLPDGGDQITIPMQSAGGGSLNSLPRCDVQGGSSYSIGSFGGVYYEPEPTPITPPPPGVTPTLAPETSPICKPAEVAASASWQQNGQNLEGQIVMTNTASVPCSLTTPYFEHIAIIDGSGKPLPVVTGLIPPAEGVHKFGILTLQSQDKVTVAFTWSNWCSLVPPGPFSLQIRFYGNPSAFVAPVHDVGGTTGGETPTCQDPSKGSSLDWSNYELVKTP